MKRYVELCIFRNSWLCTLKNVANLGGPSEMWTCYVAYDWLDWNVLRFDRHRYLYLNLCKYTFLSKIGICLYSEPSKLLSKTMWSKSKNGQYICRHRIKQGTNGHPIPLAYLSSSSWFFSQLVQVGFFQLFSLPKQLLLLGEEVVKLSTCSQWK